MNWARFGAADDILRAMLAPVAMLATGITGIAAAITQDPAGLLYLPASLLTVAGAFTLYRRAGRTLRDENEVLSSQLANERKTNAAKDEEIERLRTANFALRLHMAEHGIKPPN